MICRLPLRRTCLEENYPTVNMESVACGTPVVTFNTGGSPETIDSTCGIVTPKGDFESLFEAINHICQNKPFSKERCIKKAQEYDM